MRTNILRLSIVVAALCSACETGHYQDAAKVGPLPGQSATVITPLHYFESGRRAVDRYLEEHSGWSEVAARSTAACVRIEIRIAVQGSDYTEVQGSGFLIGRRRVLTSGHSLSQGAPHSIRVTLKDGRSFAAKVLASSFEVFASTNLDVALLELETEEDLPSLEVAAPQVGETVIIPGYPGKHGVNQAGHIVSGHRYRDDPLEPLVAVAAVEEASPVVLRPVAGSIPTGGMSGSPIVNAEGRAVGIFNQVVTTPERSGVVYSYAAASSLEWKSLVTGSD